MYISYYNFMLGVISKMRFATSIWHANWPNAFLMCLARGVTLHELLTHFC